MPDKPASPEQLPDRNEGHIERTLRELYVDRRHSDEEIAEALGVNRVTVTKWRKRWGITRDDRPAIAL